MIFLVSNFVYNGSSADVLFQIHSIVIGCYPFFNDSFDEDFVENVVKPHI